MRTFSATPFVVRIPVVELLSDPNFSELSATTYLRFIADLIAMVSRYDFAVKMARKRTARKMRKMQVPAYAPALDGVQEFEYRGVFVAVKKTMLMPP
jgi:hypothetical protein